MITVGDIASAIERLAPLGLQESYDNAGLTIGRNDDEVHGVLIAVDVTEEVMDEAERLGCDMIVTHHPIVFHAMKRFNSSSIEECIVERAIRTRTALYACHTNLDSVAGGMSWMLGRKLGLDNMRTLQPSDDSPNGFGIVGELLPSVGAAEFFSRMKTAMSTGVIRHSRIVSDRFSRVAVCTGAGGSLMGDALRSGCDLYVTADLKYNDFFYPNGRFTVADVGHFESEKCAIDILHEQLSKSFTNFALHKSLCSATPVLYYV